MKWKRASNKFGKTPVPVTPYQKAGQIEDRRLGLANARGNRWCLAFCGAMGLAALSTSGLIYQSAQASIVPWVVEVDETGAVKASGPAHNDFKPSDAQIAHQLARFISNVRSVSIDPVVLRENWLSAYNYATDQAALTLNTYANENDPFADIGQRSVTVDVTSIGALQKIALKSVGVRNRFEAALYWRLKPTRQAFLSSQKLRQMQRPYTEIHSASTFMAFIGRRI